MHNLTSAGAARRCLLFVLVWMLCLCCACAGAGEALWEEPAGESVEESTETLNYDSMDTAILVEKSAEDPDALTGASDKGTVTLYNLNTGRNYTLLFDGSTRFCDKYGQSISAAQLRPGDIVDVAFRKEAKRLVELSLSPESWSLDQVTYFELDSLRGELTVGQDTRKLKVFAGTHYFQGNECVENPELLPMDVLSFSGIDKEVYTVRIERSHGFLRLTGAEKFAGGWIEVGKDHIQRIADGMLMTVPDGKHTVTFSKNENYGEREIEILPGEECVLDIGDVEVAEPEYGTVIFQAYPEGARLYVDGEKISADVPITLLYGIHQLTAKAQGYQTLTQYLKVGQPAAELEVELEPVSGESKKEEEDKKEELSRYLVRIDAPADVEVYVDGNYIGIAPCSFKKVAGTHVILLSKKGYISRSYTVPIDEERKDVSYTFSELEKEE